MDVLIWLPLQILYTLCMFMLNKLIDWLTPKNVLLNKSKLAVDTQEFEMWDRGYGGEW